MHISETQHFKQHFKWGYYASYLFYCKITFNIPQFLVLFTVWPNCFFVNRKGQLWVQLQWLKQNVGPSNAAWHTSLENYLQLALCLRHQCIKSYWQSFRTAQEANIQRMLTKMRKQNSITCNFNLLHRTHYFLSMQKERSAFRSVLFIDMAARHHEQYNTTVGKWERPINFYPQIQKLMLSELSWSFRK